MKFLAILLVATLALVEGHPSPPYDNDECHPPPPPHHHHHHHKAHEECCKNVPTLSKPDKLKKAFDECHEELGIPRPPPPPPHGDHGPPPHGDHVPPPEEGMEPPHHHGKPDFLKFDCLGQCVFKKFDLLDEQNKVKESDLKKMVQKEFTGEWEKLGGQIVQKCIDSAAEGINEKSKCKSGSEQILRCVIRSVFLQCPEANWSASEHCSEIKVRMEKCPNMLPPFPGHEHHEHKHEQEQE